MAAAAPACLPAWTPGPAATRVRPRNGGGAAPGLGGRRRVRRGVGLPMIRHIVLFSAKDPAEIEAIREGLSRLGRIPQARRVEVALNAKRDSLSQEIDVVVYGEFDDFAQLEAFKAHPLYAESVAIVRPRRELRFVVDYEVPEPA